MSYNINKVVESTRPGSVKFPDGSSLNFEYRPMAYTPDHEDAVDLARDERKAGSTFKAMLIPLLASWDVVDEVPRVVRDKKTGEEVQEVGPDGKPLFDEVPVKIDQDGFSRVPLRALGAIMDFITTDINGPEAKDTSSEGSFA